jgi:hypothetical protein
MPKPIGRRLHGIIDYVTGVTCLALSRLPMLRGRFAGRALLIGGANSLTYSALTDYEVGIVRVLPYQVHLVLDALSALGLGAVAAMQDDPIDRYVPLGLASMELCVVLLSERDGS